MTTMRAAHAMQRCIAVGDASGVAEARREAAALGTRLGLDEATNGALALGVTEAASNIVKHAGRGEILVRAIGDERVPGVEVLALDRGPGMADVSESLRDGHSTAGSPGTGLGAMQRQTSAFEVYTRPGQGTVVRFEVWGRGPRPAVPELGVVCLARRGEELPGDDWVVVEEADACVLFVADGLGHGDDAARAARSAVESVLQSRRRTPAEIMAAVDGALRPTRGAAAAVAVLRPDMAACLYCGVGNIAASVHAGGIARRMVSHNGILGHSVRRVQEFQYPFPSNGLCILHSDGLATRWDLGTYPGLEACHPALIAAALYRDHTRGRDDVTVLACRGR